MVLLGAAESIHDIHLTYGRYFLLNFPVIGVMWVLALPILIVFLFPDRPKIRESGALDAIQVVKGQ